MQFILPNKFTFVLLFLMRNSQLAESYKMNKHMKFIFAIALVFFTCHHLAAQKLDTAALKRSIIEQYSAGNTDSALMAIDSFLRTDSTNWEIWDVLTLIHLDQNDETSTRSAAQKAAFYAQAQGAALYSKYGYEAFNTHKNTNLATFLFQQALALDKDSWQAYAGIGVVYLEQDKFVESRDAFKNCLNTIPQEYAPDLWVAYALALHKSGDSNQGLDYVQKALLQSDKQTVGYEVRAEIFKDTKQYAAALNDYTQMLTNLEADQSNSETARAQIYNLRALLYDAWGSDHRSDAIADARRAHEVGITQAYDSLALKYATPLGYLSLKVGSVLRFRVNNEYDLQATIKTMNSGENLEIEYTATSDSGAIGTVSIPQRALEQATVQHIFYSSEGETTLEDSVIGFWVSRRALQELKTQRSTQIDPNESGESKPFRNDGNKEVAFLMGGQFRKVNALHAIAEQEGEEWHFLLLDQADQPLILRMDAAMPLQLIEIIP